MSSDQRLALILSAMGIIFIPLLGLILRITIKWTRIEDRLSNIGTQIEKVVEDKDKVHTEMLTQMREDRRATDARLRWLETNLWQRGSNK